MFLYGARSSTIHTPRVGRTPKHVSLRPFRDVILSTLTRRTLRPHILHAGLSDPIPARRRFAARAISTTRHPGPLTWSTKRRCDCNGALSPTTRRGFLFPTDQISPLYRLRNMRSTLRRVSGASVSHSVNASAREDHSELAADKPVSWWRFWC